MPLRVGEEEGGQHNQKGGDGNHGSENGGPHVERRGQRRTKSSALAFDLLKHVRITLGPHVQTLTKAMTSILCKGLDGITPEMALDVPADFVPKIVGADLVRQRSQTVYYILTRMKSICRVWLNRERGSGA